MAYCSCRYRCVCIESLVARMPVLYLIKRSGWSESKVYSVKNLLKSATKLIVVLGKVCLRWVSPFEILSFSCPCSDLQRSGSSPFSKKIQTCSPSCNWNSTKIDKIHFLLFLDIKLHMYDITVIYIQKKMNLFWGLQVGLCSTPIAYSRCSWTLLHYNSW